MSTDTHRKLRRWAREAGYAEQELDEAAQRMHEVIRDEVLREAAAKIRDAASAIKGASPISLGVKAGAARSADLIDPDKEDS